MPGTSHGQKTLAGYSPWSCSESDATECAHTHPRTHSYSNQIRKSNKRNPNWQGRSKTVTVYQLYDTIYINTENVKDTTEKLLKLINEFSTL